MKAGILTISDKGSRHEREDVSGPAVSALLSAMGAVILKYEIIPDEVEIIKAKLVE